MNTEISHLTVTAAALLGEADNQRIRAIRSRRWLIYPRAKQVLDRLNLLVDHPRGTRMPSLAIYGDSGMGKTMIMKRFRDQHPPSFNPITGKLKTPVLAMEMTSRPGERRFYAELLTLLGAPQRPRADIAQMEQAALRIMEAIGVQVLVIDEAHNILAGTYREQRIVLNTLLTKEPVLDLFLNPSSCQGLVTRAIALTAAGWNLRRAHSVLHGDHASLHAKFVLLATGQTEVTGRVYLGSGNLSQNGFERAANAGGNLEAGVVVDLPKGQKWPSRKNSKESIARLLPVQFRETVTLATLQTGTDFVPPEEPESLPPISWLVWNEGILSTPDGTQAMVIGADGNPVETPCKWPAPAPVIVTLVEGNWRLPVISAGALVVTRPPDMTVEDVLATLAYFPEPDIIDHPDDGGEGSEAFADPSDASEARPATYAIRRMMELLVRLGEVQVRIDPRDWQRWCRELRESLCAISLQEQSMIEFFRKAGANPLPALADTHMRPSGATAALLIDSLSVVAKDWKLDDCPSLWDRENA